MRNENENQTCRDLDPQAAELANKIFIAGKFKGANPESTNDNLDVRSSARLIEDYFFQKTDMLQKRKNEESVGKGKQTDDSIFNDEKIKNKICEIMEIYKIESPLDCAIRDAIEWGLSHSKKVTK